MVSKKMYTDVVGSVGRTVGALKHPSKKTDDLRFSCISHTLL